MSSNTWAAVILSVNQVHEQSLTCVRSWSWRKLLNALHQNVVDASSMVSTRLAHADNGHATEASHSLCEPPHDPNVNSRPL